MSAVLSLKHLLQQKHTAADRPELSETLRICFPTCLLARQIQVWTSLPISSSPHFGFHYSLHSFQDSLQKQPNPSVCLNSARMKVQIKVLWFFPMHLIPAGDFTQTWAGGKQPQKITRQFLLLSLLVTRSIPLPELVQGLGVKRLFPAVGGNSSQKWGNLLS